MSGLFTEVDVFIHMQMDGFSRAPTGFREEEEELPLLTIIANAGVNIATAHQQSDWWKSIIDGLVDSAPSLRT
jgi:hypothetical protein